MNRSLRIALAEDEPETLEYFTQIVTSLGHLVVVASREGRELLRRCREARPDLLIVDIKMPEMDGIDAAIEIFHEMPVPVILVSGYHDGDLITRAEADLVMAYLVKPIKRADLAAEIPITLRCFEQFQSLRQETTNLQQALEDRKVIERAKAILMKRIGLDDQGAFTRLHQLASDKNQKMAQIAEAILTAEDALGPPKESP
jgi:AmiR/NasT family two-component response regulator